MNQLINTVCGLVSRIRHLIFQCRCTALVHCARALHRDAPSITGTSVEPPETSTVVSLLIQAGTSVVRAGADRLNVEFSFLLPALGSSPAACWQERVAGTIRMRNDSEVWANLQGLHRGES